MRIADVVVVVVVVIFIVGSLENNYKGNNYN